MFDDIAFENNVNRDQVIEAFKLSLIAGGKKDGQIRTCRVEINEEKCEVSLFKQRIVVGDYVVVNRGEVNADQSLAKMTQITLTEAKQIKPRIKIGYILEEELDPSAFSLSAARIVKNTFRDNIMKLQKEELYNYFKQRENTVIKGRVLQIESDGQCLLDIGHDITTLLPRKEVLPNDRLHVNAELSVLITNVDKEKEKTFINSKGKVRHRDYYIKNLKVLKDETRVDILNHFGLERTAFDVLDDTKLAFQQNLHKGENGHQFEKLVKKMAGNKLQQFARLDKEKKTAIKEFYRHLLKNDKEIKTLHSTLKQELEKTQIRMFKHLESKDVNENNKNLEREKRKVNNFVKTRLFDFENRMCNLILKETLSVNYRLQKPLLEVFDDLKENNVIPKGIKSPTRKIENFYLSTEKKNKNINYRTTRKAVSNIKRTAIGLLSVFNHRVQNYHYDFRKEKLTKESLQYYDKEFDKE